MKQLTKPKRKRLITYTLQGSSVKSRLKLKNKLVAFIKNPNSLNPTAIRTLIL